MPDPIKLGLDYSARRLPGASIRDAGYSFVFRYLNFPGQRWPALTKAEYDDLTLHGIEVHAVFEISVDDPSTGAVGGRQNAVTAVNSARLAGLPQGSTIFMCADNPVSKWTYSMKTAMEYLDAARVIIEDSGYVIGAYGFKEFIYAAQDGGHADVFWLCGAESGVRDGIHAYQWNNGRVYVDGLECDLNKMYIEIGDSVNYEQFLSYLQRAMTYDLRPHGEGTPGQDWSKGPTVFETLDALNARVDAVKAANAEILAAVAKLQTGGVSEEQIGKIAVEAVKDDLSD